MTRRFDVQFDAFALEPRIVFDGAAVDTAFEVADMAGDVDQGTLSEADRAHEQLVDALMAPATTDNEYVFIDQSVDGYRALLDELNPAIQVVLLDGDTDGVEQIARTLEGKSDVGAVHIISHGRSGTLDLGSTKLTEASMASYHVDEMKIIRDSLSESADILLYGCDFGANARGVSAVEALARATGADVAASEDLTGNTTLGGDWDLEVEVGDVGTDELSAPEWNGVLAPLTISATTLPIITGATGTEPNTGANLQSGGVGFTALWTNAGIVGGSAIDVRATVTGITTGSVSAYTVGDDPTMILNAPGSATIQWEIFASGTGQTVTAIGSPSFSIADIDGVGGAPNTRETISPELNGLTSYTIDNPTNLVATVSAAGVEVSGTQNQNGESASLTSFSWVDVSSWSAQYTFAPGSGFANAFYVHDGDGDLTFANANTTNLLGIDLDASDNTAAGFDYEGTFVELGSPVPIVDTDITISQNVALGTDIHRSQVTLTNAQSGDQLLVNGSTASSGSFTAAGASFTYAISSSAGQIEVVISGTATPAQYEAALQLVGFQNTIAAPSTADRLFDVSVTNLTFGTTSNVGTSTVEINVVPIATPSTSNGDEDTDIPVDLVGTDVDGTVDFVTVTTLPLPAQGILYLPNGTTPVTAGIQIPAADAANLIFTPALNFNGDVTIPFTVTDDDGLESAPANEVITVNDVNDPPVATPSTSSGGEDTDIPVDLVGTDVDGTVDFVTVTTLPLPAQGILYLPNGTTPVTAGTQIPAADAANLIFTPALNFNGDVTIPFTVTDDDGLESAPANEVITVVPVADSPVLDLDDDNSSTITGNDYETTFTEGDSGVAIADIDNLISDVDSTQLNQARVTLTPIGASDDIDVVGTLPVGMGFVKQTLVNGDIRIRFTGVASLADYQTALAQIEFTNSSLTPNTTDRIVTVDVRDTDGQRSNRATTTINVVDVLSPPALVPDPNGDNSVNGNFQNTFTENGSPVSIVDADATVTDIDSTEITGATVILTNPFPGDSVQVGSAVRADGSAVPIASTITTLPDGRIQVSMVGSSATPDDFARALNVITFSTPSENPDPTDRVFEITLTDDSGTSSVPVQTVIEVIPVNDIPALDLDSDDSSGGIGAGYQDTFVENDTGTPIADSTGNFIMDLDDANMQSMNIVLTNPEMDDALFIDPAYTAPAGLTVVLAPDGLSVAISGNMPIADYQAALEAVRFVNNSESPVEGARLIDVQVNDGEDASNIGTAEINVQAVNDPPIPQDPANPGTPADAMPDQSGEDADVLAAFDVTPYFSDPDDAVLTYSLDPTNLPAWLSINAAGEILGTPPADASQNTNFLGGSPGEYDIVVVATDPDGLPAQTTVRYTISNPPPVAQDDDLTISENGADITGSVFDDNGNTVDADPDGDAFMLTEVNGNASLVNTAVAGSAGGLFTLESDGSYTFADNGEFESLAVNETLDTTVTYTIDDGEGDTSTATVTVTVTGTNDDPVPVDPLDPNGPADPNAYIPDQTGEDSSPITGLDLTSYFADPDGTDTVTLTISPLTLPPGLTFNGTSIVGTPNANASQFTNVPGGTPGTYIIPVTATDGNGGTFATSVTYTITNPPPVAQNDDLMTGEDSAPITGSVYDDNGNGIDEDPDGDAFAVTQVNGDAANLGVGIPGSNGGTFTINADGSYSFNPGADFQYLDDTESQITTVSYQISDGEGGTSEATVAVTVNGANDAPIPVDPTDPNGPTDPNDYIPDQSGTDNQPLTPLDVTPYFTDVDVNDQPNLTYTATGLPTWLSFDPANPGTLIGTPPLDASQNGPNSDGDYPFTVTVFDGDETFTTTLVYSIGNLPPDAMDDQYTAQEDTVLTVPVGTGIIGSNDTDGDGDPLSVTQLNGAAIQPGVPVTLASGAILTLNTDGSFDYDPNGQFEALGINETGTDFFEYQIGDGDGLFDTARVDITVQGANDAPIPVDPTQPVLPPNDPANPNPPNDPDDPRAPPVDPLNYIPQQPGDDGAPVPPLDLTPYFGDPDSPDVPVLTVDDNDLPPGLTFDPVTGTITGTPDANASQLGDPGTPGTYTVPVTAIDPNDPTLTFTTNVTYVISNPAPVARDDLITSDEDTVLTGTIFDPNGTPAGDIDPDGDVIFVSEVGGDPASVGLPIDGTDGGTFTINPDGTYEFDPGDDFNGLAVGESATTAITYQVSDGEGGLDEATVTVTVTGVNDGPIPVDPTQPPVDPNNPPVGVPFDPQTPFTPPLDPRNYIPEQQAVDGTSVPPLDLTPYFGDPDAPDGVTISVDPRDLPPGLTFDPNAGTISGMLDSSASQGGDPSAPGTYIIPVTATDPNGATFTTNVIYTITNPPPVAEDDILTSDEDAVLAGSLFDPNGTPAGDTDPDGDAILVIEVGGDPANVGQPTDGTGGGSFTINPDGTYEFDPGDDFNGLAAGESATTAVTYQISDGEGGFDDAVVTITVEGRNDGPIPVDPTQPPIDPNNPPAGVPFDPQTPFSPPVDSLNYIPQQPGDDGAPVPPLDLTPYFGDPDSPDVPVLTVDDNDLPPGLTFDPATGTITGTSDANASQLGDPGAPGTYTVPVTATDPNDPTLTFTTNVTYVISNPAPVARDDLIGAPEDTPTTGSVFVDNGGNGADEDPDGDTLMVSRVTTGDDPTALTPLTDGDGVATPVPGSDGGLFTVNGDGTYTFEPGEDFEDLPTGQTRTTQVVYQLSDGEGGTDEAVITITVQGANDAPIPVDPTQPVLPPNNPANPNPPNDPDDPRAPPVDPLNYIPQQPGDDGAPVPPLDLTPYFGDPDSPDVPVLTVDDNDLPPGLTFDPATGTITGTPDANASQLGDPGTPGTYTVPVTATDPNDPTLTFTTNVTYVISNPAPVARDDLITGDEDTVLTGTIFDPNGTPTGDVDPDGDAIFVSEVGGDPASVGLPIDGTGGGTFTINPDGTYEFDPGDDFNGLGAGEMIDTTITYQVSDGEGGLDEATVTVTVTGANDAPIPVDPTQPPIDPNNPPVGVPFDPQTPFTPPVDPLNYIPLQPGEDSVDQPSLDLTPYFGDPDAPDGVTVSVDPADLPPGLIFDPSTGTISGTPDRDASEQTNVPRGIPGTYIIPVTATDPNGATFTTNVTYVIENQPPVALPDQVAFSSGGDLSGSVIADDVSPDGDPISIGAVNGDPALPGQPVRGSTGGIFTLQRDGSYFFSLNGDFDALPPGETVTTEITYTLVDSGGDTSTTTLTVVIAAPDNAIEPVREDRFQDHSDIELGGLGWLDKLRQAIMPTRSAEDLGPINRFDPHVYIGQSNRLSIDLGSSAGGLYVEVLGANLGEQSDFHKQHTMYVHVFGERPDGTRLSGNAIEITMPDGSPLPGWARIADDGTLIIAPPAGQETIRLRISTKVGDTSTVRNIEIDLHSSEIFQLVERSASAGTVADSLVTAIPKNGIPVVETPGG